MLFRCLTCLGLWATLAIPAWGAVYRYVDERGVIHFTNTPTTSSFSLYRKENGDKPEVAEIIRRCSRLFQLDENLVKAVIKAESDYNPVAVSRKGALGMMQLLPQTAREMAVGDPLNAEENIRGGSRYLRLMLDQFSGDLDLALAAYNAGPTAVKRHGGIPPYEETVSYVKKVKRYLQSYRLGREGML